MSDSQIVSPKQRLLFLSLDGVVHPQPEAPLPRSWDTGVLPLLGIRFFLARPMRRIITLCEELDIGIVLTSSWRLAGFSQQELNQVFKGLVVGLTPDLSGKNYQGPLREREILAYLEAQGEGVSFATVDSSRANFSTAELNYYLAEPKGLFSDGLSAEIKYALQG
jgi:hypothetical protein